MRRVPAWYVFIRDHVCPAVFLSPKKRSTRKKSKGDWMTHCAGRICLGRVCKFYSCPSPSAASPTSLMRPTGHIMKKYCESPIGLSALAALCWRSTDVVFRSTDIHKIGCDFDFSSLLPSASVPFVVLRFPIFERMPNPRGNDTFTP